MSRSRERLKRTPLYGAHLESGARMVAFGGWLMPVQYSGINQEHHVVRNDVGIFDVSHMGQIAIRGRESLALLQRLVPGDASQLSPGKMMYSVFCTESGGVVDDLLVYCLAKGEYRLVVNAARTEADVGWINQASKAFDPVVIDDLSRAKGIIAVQGPRAEAVMESLVDKELHDLKYYRCSKGRIGEEDVLLSRSGYTGEDGFEIICEAGGTGKIWHRLQKEGARPCGLGARDTLRTEMGYCLYGHELGPEISPLEAGLSWILRLEKDVDFIGKRALKNQRKEGGYRRLVGFVLGEKGIPRPGCGVYNEKGAGIGHVSSGTFSPSLQQGIGMAFVEPNYRKRGTGLQIEIRGKLRPSEVVRPPFVPSRVKKEEK